MTQAASYPQRAVYGFGGVAAAGGSLATQATVEALRRGGNAVDAVITGALVQGVVEPPAGGLGGDAFVLVRTSDGTVLAINGSGASPIKLGSALSDGEMIPRFGPLSVAVPGFVAALHAAHTRCGSMPFSELFDPAIAYAADGFPVSAELSEAAERVLPDLERDSALRHLLLDNGIEIGSRFRQPRLAETLASVAKHGPAAFYGDIGERIATSLANGGGVLTAEDFAEHEVTWVPPVSIRYGDTEVFTHPPVSLGCVLLQELSIYERLGLPFLSPTDPARIDAMVRCKRAAFADAMNTLRDPNLGGAGADELLAEARLGSWAEQLMAMPLDDFDGFIPNTDGTDTTCVVAADAEGNVAAVIHSLFNEFGSRELDSSSGVLLNDRLANHRLALDGVAGVAPGARPLHTLNAVLVTRDGLPAMMAATPGGRGQVQTMFQVLVNAFDGGFDPQEAIDAPRWLSGAPRRPEPNDELYMERGAGPDVLDELGRRGHSVTVTDDGAADLYGSCLAVGHTADGALYAAADRRRGARTATF